MASFFFSLSSISGPTVKASSFFHWVPCFFLLLTTCSLIEQGQEERFVQGPVELDDHSDYYDPSYLRHRNFSYQERIKSVKLHPKGWEQGAPIIEPGKGQRLVLSFDDLEADVKEHYYRFIHCNADWEPSSIPEGEYLDGFYEDRIRGERFSFDTEQDYTHYRLELPNERMGITRSGNYLLYVYRDTGKIEPVLTRRFMVVSPRPVKLSASVGRSNDMSRFDSGQQLRFELRYPKLDVANPVRAFTFVLQKNGRWDNAVFDPELTHMQQDQMVFGEQGTGTLFEGGNEYRAFDTKFLSGNAQSVRRVTRDTQHIEQVHLKLDEPRTRYFSSKDANGEYFVRNRNASDPALSAEYVKVHFRLDRAAPFSKGSIYVFGGLSDMQCLHSHRMRYDGQADAYRTSLYLKQGYYEYQYAYLSDDQDHASFKELEGSFYETENDYRILVYYRGVTDRADRLIKVKDLNSRTDGPSLPGQG